ncbi:MAG: nucleotidyltransferase family protein [Clostridia bacterium]|nr:nucleotidyltransferase family protein [Clostridia bacterium]
MDSQKLLFSFLKESVFGVISSEIAKEEEGKALFLLSKKHDLAHLVPYSKILGPARESFQREEILAMVRRDKSDFALSEITRVLKEENIEYLPLKGAVIADLYPKRYMRTSGDIDVLVREEDLERAVKALCEKLGYESDGKRQYHDVSLFSKSKVNLELHFNILENSENIDRLLSRVWEHVENGRMENEFLIFHIVAHASYHFLHGGCGIKPLLDLKLLLEKLDFDEEKLKEYLRETELEKFYETLLSLIAVWFEDGERTPLTDAVEAFILEGGVGGNKENSIAVQKEKNGGRFGFLFARVFLPYDSMTRYYPILKKYKIFLPFMYIVRMTRLFSPKVFRRSFSTLKKSGEIGEEKANEVKNLLKEIGL